MILLCVTGGDVICSGFWTCWNHVPWQSSDCLQPVCAGSDVDYLNLDDVLFLLMSWCNIVRYILT
jgi:hypothetical protein